MNRRSSGPGVGLAGFLRGSPLAVPARDYHQRLPFEFGVGHIDPAVLPLEQLRDVAAEVVGDLGDELARYPSRWGWEPLRALAAEFRAGRDARRPGVDSIVITNGSFGALWLVARAFSEPGDDVFVEEYTYNGAISIFRSAGLTVRPLPMDGDGVVPEAVERAGAANGGAEERRRLLYTMPTFHNPTGIVMPRARREAIARVAQEHDLLVVEDDCYGELRIEGEPLPSIQSLIPKRAVLIGSFSKILSPALRLGYLVGTPDVMEEVLLHKLDAGTDLLSSAVAARFWERHGREHLPKLRAALREKRDGFVEALNDHAGEFSVERVPDGGMFLWGRLRDDVDSHHLLQRASAAGISFFSTPMCSAAHLAGAPADGPLSFVRFCFTWPSPTAVRTGLEKLFALARDADAGGSGSPARHEPGRPPAPDSFIKRQRRTGGKA